MSRPYIAPAPLHRVSYIAHGGIYRGRSRFQPVTPCPRASAPAFTRAQLRNLRRLSGLTKPGKVLAWWNKQIEIVRMNLQPANSPGNQVAPAEGAGA